MRLVRGPGELWTRAEASRNTRNNVNVHDDDDDHHAGSGSSLQAGR
jgi:hypothetical protein